MIPNDRPVPSPESTTSQSVHRRHALGLPEGSIRALLALGLSATIGTLMVLNPARPVPAYLRDLLFIILGHYFAARHRASSSEPTGGPPPLYLPRGSVRLLLIAGFALVAVTLYRGGHLSATAASPAGMTLMLVGGFLLGVVLGRIKDRLTAGRPPAPLVEDIKALVALAAAALVAALAWDRAGPFLPGQAHEALAQLRDVAGAVGPEEVLAAVVGFYFGNRS